MFLPISVLSITIYTIMFLALSFKIISIRRREKVSLGDGGHDDLQQSIRAQGNLSEFGILGCLLIVIAELQATPILLLATAALVFWVGRVFHAKAFNAEMDFKARVTGMKLTILGLVGLCLLNLGMLFYRSFF